ncbi:hypothetical protein WN51_06479 [Melipona quadrifasciata]|uniref:Uncharacterized protein n=1 Tax=Melipona quadrifasciata TaxID=166423 RepID=A0A0N0BK86_9HYME|nr:hypothetical protein WN51_06479 [Melipona quadrifasciata]
MINFERVVSLFGVSTTGEMLRDHVGELIFQIQPPENELQKVGERVPSEHELRVQRSLQRLNVPDWYKNSPAARDGFRLKRHSDASQHGGWRALGSKTTSLSSLSSSSNRQPTTGALLSPSPTPPVFSRWSTSLLNSAGSSPASSARSSFNHRQPYLGWRSQERLTNPRTPAERLAQGILPQLQAANKVRTEETLGIYHTSLFEIRANYCSRRTVRWSNVFVIMACSLKNESRTGGFCDDWRESKEFGNASLDERDIYVTALAVVHRQRSTITLLLLEGLDQFPNTPKHNTQKERQYSPLTGVELIFANRRKREKEIVLGYLGCVADDVERSHPQRSGQSDTDEAMATAALLRNKPSPGSTTLEDVLDSLLGLPSASRTPSPGPGPVSVTGTSATMRHRTNVGQANAKAGKSCSDLRQDLQEKKRRLELREAES